MATFESWFPKNRTFNEEQFSRKGGSFNSLVWISRLTSSKGDQAKIKWTLTPSDTLIGVLTLNARFKTQSPVRYKCDRRATQAATATSPKSDKALTHESDETICRRATWRVSVIKYDWATSLYNIKYVREAKRRGLTCDVGVQDISKLSAKRLCEESVYRDNWKSGALFSSFVQEAKRRGLSCGVE